MTIKHPSPASYVVLRRSDLSASEAAVIGLQYSLAYSLNKYLYETSPRLEVPIKRNLRIILEAIHDAG